MGKQNMEPQNGTCRFCRQNMFVPALIGWSQEQIDEEVTLSCKCEAAQNYKKSKERREMAKNRISELFGDGADDPISEEVLNIMNHAVDAIESKEIKNITIDLGHGIRGKVAKTAKESIKVERSEKKTQSYED